MKKAWPYVTPGIPDDLFIRGSIPMTKEEIRAVTLAKARLGPGQVVWDIGSGTGSIAIEAARLIGDGIVYAVEQKPAALELIRENMRRFAQKNIQVVEGRAPEALLQLPPPHRVFIGGSGGQLGEIVQLLAERLAPGARLVINALTLETLTRALTLLGPPWEKEVVQVSVTRTVSRGHYHLMHALNPVWIITAQKEGGEGVG
ncbi:precorrin-6Y C5,15-methyltransferase (decarboxylating) CbiT subunit [Desulfofundulus luciae]|uniref:Precorrin-6Y C5,15-methyltransferase (Decarboxylating) CbiT subunit n=1 Tax=Desulfofundulus luciae TaxID=74702 RepID=A0ABU0B409_9FIRM|nr:precorrin-6Y C5,15-methyltransferase (decarboxylating) subunit CbiT [Desulfofundulus luciae]MDQ0287458.1 precorrin-6Y C5,15-methyltransferase (decarboxylating) CbiT subunit [Desulfofundulus luciae]